VREWRDVRSQVRRRPGHRPESVRLRDAGRHRAGGGAPGGLLLPCCARSAGYRANRSRAGTRNWRRCSRCLVHAGRGTACGPFRARCRGVAECGNLRIRGASDSAPPTVRPGGNERRRGNGSPRSLAANANLRARRRGGNALLRNRRGCQRGRSRSARQHNLARHRMDVERQPSARLVPLGWKPGDRGATGWEGDRRGPGRARGGSHEDNRSAITDAKESGAR
jgi:hypothetical protein